MVYDYIQNNFVTVINIIFLAIFLKSNTLLDKKSTQKFWVAIILLTVVTIAENVEIWTKSLPYPTMLRVWMSIIGYSCRPLIVYALILIVLEGEGWFKKFLPIPAIINILMVSTALFSDVAFSYDEANEFVRGPLGFSAYIASAFYLVIILFLSARFFRERYYMEAVIVLAIVIVCALATGLEAIWKHVGLLRSASGLSITFFYLYMYAQIFKRDALTGVLNRRCFDLDAAKYQNKITAIISVDLNDLKTINDVQGHAEGDKAIRATIDCIRKSLMRGCVLYRVGGDEFTILCIKRKASELQNMVEGIRKLMAETPYTCAVGMAERRENETFEELCARADEEMYENKAVMKRKK